MKKIVSLILVISLILTIGGCKAKDKEKDIIDIGDAISTSNVVTETEDIVPEPEPEPVDDIRTATFGAVGDIMYHDDQLERGYNSNTDTFDLYQSFQYFDEYLKAPDYMIANMETTLAGKNKGSKNDIHGYCEWPRFNSPEILATNIKDSGIDLVTTVNNHSLDSDIAGVNSTLDFLDAAGVEHLGTYRSQEEKDTLFIKDINGITFGITSYTYCTNGITIPEGYEYVINDLNWYAPENVQKMVDEIKALDESGVDFVVVSLHMGNEYEENQYSFQEDMVDKAFEAGADIILGGHPHVLQPMEIRTVGEGVNERMGIVIYSLGNFISSQIYTGSGSAHKDLGTMLEFKFQKINDEPATIENLYVIPTISYWSDDEISVLPLKEALENPEKFAPLLNTSNMERLLFAETYSINHLTKYLDYEIAYNNYKFEILLKKPLTNE
jgi:poly-gamma-glutamate synthesis protein (capsule biosynthesis protein)